MGTRHDFSKNEAHLCYLFGLCFHGVREPCELHHIGLLRFVQFSRIMGQYDIDERSRSWNLCVQRRLLHLGIRFGA